MEYGVIYYKFLVKVFSKSCQINLIKNLNFSYKTFFIVYALNMPDRFSQLRLRSISKQYLSFFCTHLTRWDFKHTFSTHYYWPLNGHEFLKPAIFLNIFIFSFLFNVFEKSNWVKQKEINCKWNFNRTDYYRINESFYWIFLFGKKILLQLGK